LSQDSFLFWLFFPSGLRPDEEEFLLQSYAKRVRLGAILGVLFMAFSNLPDLYLTPDLFQKLFAIRAVVTVFCLYTIYLLGQPRSIISITWIFYSLMLAGVTVAGLMIYFTGGCSSRWALVSGLVMLIAASVSHLPPRIMVVFSLMGLAGYLIPVVAHGHFSHSPDLTSTHLFFYSAFMVLAVSVSALQHRVTLQIVAEIRRIKDIRGALKIREEELSSKNREIETHRGLALDFDKAQTEFLANISHELRTPLTSILGFSSLLENSGQRLQNNELEMLKKIQSQGMTLLGVIENLVDFSAISNSRLELNLRPVLMNLIIYQVMDALQLEIAAAGHKVRIICSKNDRIVNVDHEWLTQALTHLLSNAIKFTPKGTGILQVGCRDVRDGVEIFVKDNGIGIEPEKQELIFQVFRQGDGSSTRKHGGAGLGLPIVKRIIELHGGSIRVKSEPGQGAEFILTLPLIDSGQAVNQPGNEAILVD